MAEIVMYTRSWCGFCQRAKALLDEKGQRYTEHDVELDPAREAEMLRRAKLTSVPQIFIGEVHIGGYDDMAELERRGELDKLLAAGGAEA